MTGSHVSYRSVALVAGTGLLFAALIVAGFARADHSSGDPMIYGWVMDGADPVSGANVWFCWDPTTQPDVMSCFPTSADSDETESDGHWYSQDVSAGFWTVWAEKDGNMSQFVYFYFDGSGQFQVEGLLISGSGSGQYILHVTKDGAGNIVSTPSGINCGFGGDDCDVPFMAGTSVTLMAQDDTLTGSIFNFWSGDCFGSGGCTVVMDMDRWVTADFTDGRGTGSGIPAAPSPPWPQPPPTEMTISLTWFDHADNEDSYVIDRSPTGAETWTFIAALPEDSTTYVDTTVTPGVWYDYRVQACLQGVGCSAYGTLWQITTDPGANGTIPPPTGTGTGSIAGTVIEDGFGRGGVALEIYQEGGAGFLTSTGTDEGGYYSFLDLPLGWTYKVRALAPSGLNPPDQFWALSDGTPHAIADFFLGGGLVGSSDFTISGTVRLTSGAGVGDAVVEAYNPVSGDFYSAETSDTGPYELAVPCGTWELWVRPATASSTWYYNGFNQSVFFDCSAASGSAIYDFEVFGSDATVTGRILYPDGSVPPEFSVYVDFWNDQGGFGGPTDANGVFSIMGAAGLYEMHIWSDNPDYSVPGTLGNVNILSGVVTDLGTITLVTKDSAIEGHVRDESGAGISGVRVGAYMPEGSGWAEAFSDANGFYRLSVVAGTWEINAEPDATLGIAIPQSYMRIDVLQGQTVSGVDFTAIGADSTITGQLVNSSGALLMEIRDAWVYIEHENFGTPVFNGTFTLPVPAGTYLLNVWIAPESGFFSEGGVTVTVPSGGSVSVDLIVLIGADGGTIEGRIIDTSGALVRNVELEVFAGGDYTWIPGTVDKANGTYRISVPPGIWWVGVDVFGSDYAVQGGAELSVSQGQTVTHDFVLVRADATIEVTVRRPDGSPFPHVGVEASPFSILAIIENIAEFATEFDNAFFGDTDSSGIARISVPAGTYYLHSFAGEQSGLISPPEFAVTVAAGQVGTATLTYREPNATITGQVRIAETGSPATDAFVGGWSTAGGLSEGNTDAAGNYTLVITGEDTWYIKAFGNINGILYEADPIEIVSIGAGGVIVQDILLKSSGFLIPEPFATLHDVDEPFSSMLDNGTAVSCGANAFGTTGDVNISIVPNLDAPEYAGTNIIGIAYDIEARREDGSLVRELNGNIFISIPYTDNDVLAAGITESDLRIGFLDETTGAWVRLDSTTVDTDDNIATAVATHLTRFALLTPAYAVITGPTINEGDLIRGPDGVKVWIVNANGYKRHIFNPAVFGMYGHFVWENIVEVSLITLDSYTTSDLYRADGDEKVFLLEEVDEAAGLANKRWLNFSAAEFLTRGYNWLQVFIINPVERDFYQEGTPIT